MSDPAGQEVVGPWALEDLRLLEHFNRTQRLSSTGSWEAVVETGELIWSAQVYSIFGVSPETFRPTVEAFLERVHPEDRMRVQERVGLALNGTEAFLFDHRIVLPDGSVRIVLENAEVVRDARGRPYRIAGALQDVTSLRAGEAAARRGEETLATMLRISPEAIIVTDASARILAFSAGAEEIFGYGADEVMGRGVEQLLPARFHAEHRRHVARFSAGEIRSLRMHERVAIVGRRRSGEEFPAEASLAKLETPDGDAFTAIVRDLSDRKESERRLIEAREQAEKANLAKSTFLANMSHEIRTPLNGVLGVAGALARSQLTPKQQQMVGLIESSGRALERLLGDILDLAKLDAGRMSIRAEAFDLGDVVRDTVELFRASAAEKGVELVTEVAPDAMGCFLGDDLRLRQVLSNLLSNAVKFTARGHIRVAVGRHAGSDGAERMRFVVKDTGIGFSPDAAESVFERFEQADGSVTRRFGGTGLGLAISRTLVHLMGGTISATSSPGRGATFRFDVPLPAVDADPVISASPRAAAPGNDIPPLRILLAEDHVVNRLTVELILEDLPVQLVSVENGQEAVDAFAAEAFDLVLMDMQMPVMDGLAAIRLIRDHEARLEAPRTPICVLTANAMAEHRAAAEAAGADAFLTKPMNAQALISHVLEVARRSEAAEHAAWQAGRVVGA